MKKFVTLIVTLFLACGAFAGSAVPMSRADSAEAPVNRDIKSGTVTLVNEETDLTVKLTSGTEEDYLPSSRTWNGIPTVIKSGQNIFVCWYTGGDGEPRAENYGVVAASGDGGETWEHPFMIIDPVDESQMVAMPMFYQNAEGEIFLCWVQDQGVFNIQLLHADGPLDEVRHTEVSLMAPHPGGRVNAGMFNKPTLLSDGRLVYASGRVDSYFYVTEDGGRTFENVSKIETTAADKIGEACVVEKADGVLWYVSRIEGSFQGGMEESFSYDGGQTWTVAQSPLDEPLQGPGSRFNIQRLQSGALIFIGNQSGFGSTRSRLTAWLSYDDGETWPYSLVLDPLESSYPDCFQDADGTIYIVYDKERHAEGSIRLTVLTEEDIKAGEFVSEVSRDKNIVYKMNWDHADIMSVNGAFEREMHYKVGTELTDLLATLPTTISVTDSNGVTREVTGSYRVPGYQKDTAGVYTAYFQPFAETYGLKDSFSLYTFRIVLEGGGCSGFGFAGLTLAGVGLLSLLFRKNWRH